MAIPTLVNGQITDALSQSTLTVLGNAPAQAAGSAAQVAAEATALQMLAAQAATARTALLREAATARLIRSFDT